MANQLVTDLDAIITLPDSGIIHVIDTTVTTQNAAGSSFKITKANLLKENTAAILLNTAKVGITPTQASAITNNTNKVGYTDALVTSATSVVLNTAKVGITPSQTSAITANTSKVGYTDALVAAAPTVVANTAKVGISTVQANAITVNTSKVGYTDALVAAAPTVIANTAKVGITSGQSSAITVNTAKVGYTDALVAAAPSVVANSAKVGITPTQASAINANTSKVGYTDALVAAAPTVIANTAKVGITSTQATNITTNASLLNIIINNSVIKYVRDFRSRVLADSGTIENITALTTNLTAAFSLASFNTITALLLPSATKLSKVYLLLPENGGADSTVVRNTTATTTNSAGNIVIVAANVARINYPTIGGEGFLLDEPQRTNSLTNSVLAGASTPSTLPTNFSFSGNGLSFSVVGIGTDINVNYIDVRFFGTATATGTAGIRTNLSNSIAATQGQNWSPSGYIRIIAQPLPPTEYRQTLLERNSSLGIVGGNNVTFSNTTLQRIVLSTTTVNAATAFIQQEISALLTSGVAYDFTIRIAAPQIEQGVGATSFVPTTSAAVTRNADVITVTPPASTLKITTTFSNNSTQVLTTIPATYTVPEGLIKSVSFNNTL
jgi:hypothetical protein